MASETVILVEDLSFKYQDSQKEALSHINLAVNQGEFIAIVGATGAGKSSLCFTFNGLIPHFLKGEFKGKVTVCGKNTQEYRVSELAQTVGLVFQDFESQLFSTNVTLEVAFMPENFQLPPAEIEKRIEESLSLVGLSEYKDRDTFTLSGGEKQRLAIASVLAGKPQILVLDEPTTDLDPLGRVQVLNVIYELKKKGHTLILVEHDTEKIIDADKLLIMDNGKIIFFDKPRKALEQPYFLEKNGIAPIEIAQLALIRGIKPPLPLTLEDSISVFDDLKSRFVEEEYNTIIEQELQRERKLSSLDPIIEIDNLWYVYPDGIEALSGIKLVIRKGEFIAIIGQNGSGKTTLAKHLNGVLYPTKGTVKVKGRDTRSWKKKELAKLVGYVFQNPDHQIFADTVYDEIAFGPRNFGLSEKEIESRVKESLSAVKLPEHYKELDPFSLTKGERQKVAVASLLAARPEVLILDEPTTGLDYTESLAMLSLLNQLNKMGYTIIIITHSLWLVARYAHRTIVMHRGKILVDGDTRSVFSEEEKLEKANIILPSLIRLSNRLGKTLLSLSEFIRVYNLSTFTSPTFGIENQK